MNTRKRTKSRAVLTIRLAILVSKDEYRKLNELANQAKCSMGAVVRALICEAK